MWDVMLFEVDVCWYGKFIKCCINLYLFELLLILGWIIGGNWFWVWVWGGGKIFIGVCGGFVVGFVFVL